MNSSYQVNRFYAQERVNAQLKAAEVYRQSRKNRAGYRTALTGAATRTYSWLGRAFGQASQSLESLVQTRVALFHR